jgi:Mrp family chromosome partitioning ATPase
MANVVDGVLLTVRVGRRQTEEDAVMVRSLAQSDTRIIGVVAVASERIASFASTRAGLSAPESRSQSFDDAVDELPAAAFVQAAGA